MTCIFLTNLLPAYRGEGRNGERRGEGQEGRGREDEVNCHAQLKQGRQLAIAGPTLIVLE